MNEQITVNSSLEATRLAGSMAGERGGVWSHNPDCTVFVVAQNTSEFAMRKANRWATITVKP